MDKATLDQIKKGLLEEKTRLEAQVAALTPKEGAGAYEAAFPKLGDKEDENAAEVDEYTTNLAVERTLDGTLRDIIKALERLENGTYGLCKYCGKEIDPKRLTARPVSSACIECKKRLTQEA